MAGSGAKLCWKVRGSFLDFGTDNGPGKASRRSRSCDSRIQTTRAHEAEHEAESEATTEWAPCFADAEEGGPEGHVLSFLGRTATNSDRYLENSAPGAESPGGWCTPEEVTMPCYTPGAKTSQEATTPYHAEATMPYNAAGATTFEEATMPYCAEATMPYNAAGATTFEEPTTPHCAAGAASSSVQDSDEHAGRASNTVMLSGLACKYVEKDLTALLDEAGLKDMYDSVCVPTHTCRGRTTGKGFAFVRLKHPSYMSVCRQLLDGKKLGDSKTNKVVKVKPATHGPHPDAVVASGSGQSIALVGCGDSGPSGQEPDQVLDMRPAHPWQGESLPAHLTLQTSSAAGTTLTQWYEDIDEVMEDQMPIQAKHGTSARSEVGALEDEQPCPPHTNGNDQADGCFVIVHNIPSRFMEDRMADALRKIGLAGTYDNIHVPFRRRSRRASNKGFGVVSFKDVESAMDCCRLLTGARLGCDTSQQVVEVEFYESRLRLPAWLAARASWPR